MADKVKLTFVLPMMLQDEFKHRVAHDGYDLKEKSRWVAEAIETLLMTQNFPELVKISDTMQGFEKHESVIIAKVLKQRLDQAIISIRRVYPELDGVQSKILRTAIVQRLLRC